MKKIIILILLSFPFFIEAQNGIQWQQRLGGIGTDQANCIIQTADSGYAVIGQTDSNDSVVYGNHGGNDYLFYKLDKNGNQQWHRWYGSSADDIPTSIIQTPDGGYLIAGLTWGNNGDVSGNHGEVDVWLIKTNGEGFIEWQKCYGGTGIDGLYSYSDYYYFTAPAAVSIINTIGGGYIFATSSNSNNGDVSGNHGGYDFWVVKLNDTGAIQWQNCYGGNQDDIVNSIIQNGDGSYVIAGYTNSDSGQISSPHTSCYVDPNWGLICTFDYLIIKIDNVGNLIWQKTYGGTNNDYATSIVSSHDGGYMVAGSATSADGDVTGLLGYQNYWLIKLDSSGNLQWEKCYGGNYGDVATSIINTNDGGYFVIGNSNSDSLEVTNHHDTSNYNVDVWAVKIDSTGTLLWENSFGGSLNDNASCVIKTLDGGFVIAGNTNSIDGDVIPDSAKIDFWIFKLGSNVGINKIVNRNPSILVYPNPFNNECTIKISGVKSLSITLSIYNLLGDEEYSAIKSGNNISEFILNRNQLPSGFYFYKLTDESKTVVASGKLIIE
jgi:hypothetical protein